MTPSYFKPIKLLNRKVPVSSKCYQKLGPDYSQSIRDNVPLKIISAHMRRANQSCGTKTGEPRQITRHTLKQSPVCGLEPQQTQR